MGAGDGMVRQTGAGEFAKDNRGTVGRRREAAAGQRSRGPLHGGDWGWCKKKLDGEAEARSLRASSEILHYGSLGNR